MIDAEPTPDVLRLYLGRPYRHSRGGLYAPLGFVRHARSATDMVLYVGLDGRERGRHYVCELSDWEARFTLAKETHPEPRVLHRATIVAERPPRRVAGAFSSGSGV